MRYAILMLMVALFIPACAAPVAASTNEAMEPPFAAQYDANANNMIERDEAIAAVVAYINGAITKEQAIEVIVLYFTGARIQEQAAPPSLAEVVAQVMPAVVKIVNDAARAQGSGAIYKVDGQNGYVITNQHIVRGADTVTVTVGNKTDYQGAVLGVDVARDLAVVRICCNAGFPSVGFGDSEQLQIGDEVLTVGYPVDAFLPKDGESAQPKVIVNPGEVSATVTRGIVSAVRYDSENDRELLQTDAPINAGNSGGPLVSMSGEIIGITTFSFVAFESEGLHFAVLETTVQERLPSLVSGQGGRPDIGGSTPSLYFEPIYGPWTGHIHHNDDQYFETVNTWQWESDVIASAFFYNPYSASTQPFSYGFRVRGFSTGDPLFFVVSSRGTWNVLKRTVDGDEYVARGQALELNTGARGLNLLTVASIGEYGWFFLNGELLTGANGRGVFHLGAGVHDGTVSIINGFFTGSERPGAITHVEEFGVSKVVLDGRSAEEAAKEALSQTLAEGFSPDQPLGGQLQAAELE